MQGDPLFEPVDFGALHLKNRVVMAPLTRCRASNPAFAPTETMARYYAQRAGAGLIVSEACLVSPQGRGYPDTPGIWSAAQQAGWRQVTEAVHEQGGRIVCQLWHCGRLSLPEFHGGGLPVAPSAIDPHWKMFSAQGLKPTVTPRALSVDEILAIVDDFARAAAHAMTAGFDGIEIHASNGYLIHQFLASSANTRDDDYGGSPANRVRFFLQILDRTIAEAGAGRVGYRINPMMNRFHGIDVDAQTLPVFEHLVTEAARRQPAYVHLTEPYLPNQLEGAVEPLADVASHFRTMAGAPLLSNGGFDPGRARDWVAGGRCEAVAFGRAFIANPDLPERIRRGAALNACDTETFYQGGERGYLDYPVLNGA